MSEKPRRNEYQRIVVDKFPPGSITRFKDGGRTVVILAPNPTVSSEVSGERVLTIGLNFPYEMSSVEPDSLEPLVVREANESELIARVRVIEKLLASLARDNDYEP